MSVIKSREATEEIIIELSKYSGYSPDVIREVITSAYTYINSQIDNGQRNPIKLPKLGSLQFSKVREKLAVHNVPDGIIKRKFELGICSNINPTRIEQLKKNYGIIED